MATTFTRWWRERRRVRAIRSARAAPRSQTLVAGAQTLPERPRILLLKLDHIGDLVLAMRAMLRIRNAWPDAHITLVCGPWNVALARQLGLFDHIIAYCFLSEAAPGAPAAVSDRHAAFAALDLGEPFDLAIDMRYDQDTRPLLEAIDARFRAGYSARNLKTALNLELPTTEQASRRDRPLLPIHAETRLMLLASAVVEVFGRPQMHPIHGMAAAVAAAESPRGPYIVVATGARKTTSKWPIANFVALCAALAEKHGNEIVVIGDGHDAAEGHAIAQALPPGRVRDSTGQVPIENLPALLSKASLYIGNDTGTTHIAAKLGVPTICVFSGAADYRVWQPVGANVRIIRVDIGCSPCHLDRKEECPVDVKCLRLIAVDDVLATALAMLGEST
jgi:ADP-heptose:LPS heptosyltransferase